MIELLFDIGFLFNRAAALLLDIEDWCERKATRLQSRRNCKRG